MADGAKPYQPPKASTSPGKPPSGTTAAAAVGSAIPAVSGNANQAFSQAVNWWNQTFGTAWNTNNDPTDPNSIYADPNAYSQASQSFSPTWTSVYNNVDQLKDSYQPAGTVTPSTAHGLGPEDQAALRHQGAIAPPQVLSVPRGQISAAINVNGAAAPYMGMVQSAANKNNVPWQVLFAVLQHESHFDPTAKHYNADGTTDVGIAQINNTNPPSGISAGDATNPEASINDLAKTLAQAYSQYHDWGLAVGRWNTPVGAQMLAQGNRSGYGAAAATYISQVFSGLSAQDWGALGWDPANDKNIGTAVQGASGIGTAGAAGTSNLPISYRLIKPDPATLQVDARQMLGGLMFRQATDTEVGQLVNYINGVYDNVSTQLQQSANSGQLPVPASASLVVQAAGTFVGTQSQFGGNQPGQSLDCSALVQQAFHMLGVQLPRTTFDQVNTGTAVSDISSAQPGDLVFFDGADAHGTGSATPNGHVGIYVGNNQVLEADWGGQPVGVHVIDAGHKITAIRREALPANAEAQLNSTLAGGGGGGAVNPTDSTSQAAGNATGLALGQGQSIDPETGYMTGPLRQKIDPQAELLTAIRQLPEYKSLYGHKPGNLTEDAYAQHFADMASTLVGADYTSNPNVGEAVRQGMATDNPDTTAQSIATSGAAAQSPTFRGLMYQRALDFGKLAYSAPASPGSTG